jgi:hypothetical protein
MAQKEAMECCCTATKRKSEMNQNPPAKLAGFAFADDKPQYFSK